jgi:hypothetical protein
VRDWVPEIRRWISNYSLGFSAAVDAKWHFHSSLVFFSRILKYLRILTVASIVDG